MPDSILSAAPAAALPDPLVATLAQARKRLLLTQADLAAQAGLSRMTVQRLESNGLDPRLSTLHEMARVLGYELLAIPQAAHADVHAALARHLPVVDGNAAAAPPHNP